MTDYDLRPIRPDEADTFSRAIAEGFHTEFRDEEVALWRDAIEPERTLAAFDGDAIVATSGLFSMRIALPGGVAPMAGVTAVTVHATHRGRGLLGRMMRGHLTAIHERGEEAIAGLWASEAGIYGRFGFGLATRSADVTIRSPDARLLAPAPDQRLRMGAPADLVGAMRAVHDAVTPTRPGMIARSEHDWRFAIVDFEEDRDGAGRLRALVADGQDGPAGYALFAIRKRDADGRPDDVVELRELVAAAPAAAGTLWEHLLGLSLTRSVRWHKAAEDEELPHMLTDPRAVGMRVDDGLFVRLVDVPRALAQRAYPGGVDVVLEVADDICPWNAGRWRLAGDASGASCEPSAAAADLALGARELGAVHLGGTPLAALAAAGRVQERAPGALLAAGHAFKGSRAPWCFEDF